MNITNNVDLNQIMNLALQGAAGAEKPAQKPVGVAVNDKGLTVTFTNEAGETQEVPFGEFAPDLPKAQIPTEGARNLVEAFGTLAAEQPDSPEVQEANRTVRALFAEKAAGTSALTEIEAIDIFQVMSLLVKVMQQQRENASVMRLSANAQAVAAIEADIAQLKDAAFWGAVASCVSAAIQFVPALTMAISAGSQLYSASKCETANGVDLAKTNYATAKLIDNPDAALANTTKLRTELSRMDPAAAAEMEDLYSSNTTAEGFAGKTFDEKVDLVLNKYNDNLRTASEAYAKNPSAENYKALQVAQKQQAYAFAVKTAQNAETYGAMENRAEAKNLCKAWKDAAGERREAALTSLANDPKYIKIQRSLDKLKIVEALLKPVAEFSGALVNLKSKTMEAEAKQYEILQRNADKMVDAMTDLYKEAKQLIDDVRSLLQAKTQSEIETERKIMV